MSKRKGAAPAALQHVDSLEALQRLQEEFVAEMREEAGRFLLERGRREDALPAEEARAIGERAVADAEAALERSRRAKQEAIARFDEEIRLRNEQVSFLKAELKKVGRSRAKSQPSADKQAGGSGAKGGSVAKGGSAAKGGKASEGGGASK